MKKFHCNVWVTTRELAGLMGITAITLNRHCHSGRYKTAKKIRCLMGGFQGSWRVNLRDPAISDEIRDRFYLKQFVVREVLKDIEKSLSELCGKRR